MRDHFATLVPLKRMSEARLWSLVDPELVSMRAQLQESSHALQQLSGQPPPLTSATKHRIDELSGKVAEWQRLIANKESDQKADLETQQLLRSALDQLQSVAAGSEVPTGQLTVWLAQGIIACRDTWGSFLPAQNVPKMLALQQRWTMQASALLEHLAASLTADEIRADRRIVSTCIITGHDVADVKRMLQRSGSGCAAQSLLHGRLYLSRLAAFPSKHIVCLAPLLHSLHSIRT